LSAGPWLVFASPRVPCPRVPSLLSCVLHSLAVWYTKCNVGTSVTDPNARCFGLDFRGRWAVDGQPACVVFMRKPVCRLSAALCGLGTHTTIRPSDVRRDTADERSRCPSRRGSGRAPCQSVGLALSKHSGQELRLHAGGRGAPAGPGRVQGWTGVVCMRYLSRVERWFGCGRSNRYPLFSFP